MVSSRTLSLGRFAAIAGALVAIEWWIAGAVAAHPVIGLAITLDLLVGLPLLYYVLLVRSKAVPSGTQIGAFIAAALIARFVLPPAMRGYANAVLALAPAIELLLFGLVAWRMKHVVSHYRRLRPQMVYPGDALSASLAAAGLPRRLAAIIATEALLVWAVVAGWFSAFRPQSADQQVFTYHRRSGYGAVLSVLAFGLIGETAGVHLLVSHWSPLAAWILSGLSIYTLVWLIGDFQAMRLNPIVLTATTLHLRTGMRWRIDVPREAIRSIRRASAADRRQPGYLDLAPLGNAAWIVEVERPIEAQGLFGSAKTATSFGVSVDDPAALVAALDSSAI